jgi:hypothetical protein
MLRVSIIGAFEVAAFGTEARRDHFSPSGSIESHTPPMTAGNLLDVTCQGSSFRVVSEPAGHHHMVNELGLHASGE